VATKLGPKPAVQAEAPGGEDFRSHRQARRGKSRYPLRAACDSVERSTDFRRVPSPFLGGLADDFSGGCGALAMEEEKSEAHAQEHGGEHDQEQSQRGARQSQQSAPVAEQLALAASRRAEGFSAGAESVQKPEKPQRLKNAEGAGGAHGVDTQEAPELDDHELVAATQAGDASAFDVLVLRHTSKLYGLVYHMCGNHEDTDDLLQEIWAKVFRVLPSFRGASRFSTWIHSIAVNMTLNFLKKRSRRSAVSLDAGVAGSNASLVDLQGLDPELEGSLVSTQTPRSEANLSELQKMLGAALDRLTPEHRAVVTMFDVQGMAHAEIAKIMGISEGTVRSRLFYAHRQLQGFLSECSADFLEIPSSSSF
jgi:RNA polymerase sigma factor (sigma-70 family)